VSRYDRELAPHVADLAAVDLTDVAAARIEMDRTRRAMAGEIELRGVTWSDGTIDGQAFGVPVRVYEAEERVETPTPCVVFLHGGGFVMGDIESEHLAAGVLSTALGIVVVSVDYRLAPEHPYPAALDDAFAALRWTHEMSERLHLDPDRIAVLGHSAGGGLAAALAIRARDEGGPRICFQYLGIPELDDRLTTPSSRAFVDTPLWNRSAAELSWKYYLGALHGSDSVPVTAAPGRARAEELAGLPPAYISAMANDPLRDEGIGYALNLMAAGVSVELHAFAGTFHGSSQLPAAVSKRDRREMLTVLRAAFDLPAK